MSSNSRSTAVRRLVNSIDGGSIARFRGDFKCPVCGGAEDDPRGEGVRCPGFLSGDGEYAHCGRSEYGSGCEYHLASRTWSHRMKGECRCGKTHGEAVGFKQTIKKGRPLPFEKRIEAAYPYFDAGGTLIYEVVRLRDPKEFRQRRPVGKNKYEWNLKGVSPTLYHLPAIMSADHDDVVFIYEGEKDADLALQLGLVATTNSGGAGKWRDEFGEILRNRRCCVVRDNDTAGREHGEQVAQSLHKHDAEVKIVDLPGVPDKGDFSDYIVGLGKTLEDFAKLVSETPLWKPDAEPKILPIGVHRGEVDPPDVPETIVVTQIKVTTREHEVADSVIKAIADEPNLYQRGRSLVSVIEDVKPHDSKKGVKQPSGTPRIVTLPPAQIRRLIAKRTDLVRERGGENVSAHAPAWLVDMVATMGHWKGIPPLTGVIEAPTLRPDGSLISEPGYDSETGLFYRPSIPFPMIPARPSKEWAHRAANEILTIVDDFPFQADNKGWNSSSAWLAAFLTPLARFAIDGPTPLFLIDANVAGAGKTKLTDIIAIGVSGREMARGSYSTDDNEMQKTLHSIVLEGLWAALFDNVPGGSHIGGPALDRFLTATYMNGRILGKSEMSGEIRVHTTLYATGNNLGLRGDSLRRIVPIILESPEERPEERQDFTIKGDLLAHVKRRRASLVMAGLSILRGYIEEGRPDQNLTPMDYPAWSGLVRSAVHWAIGQDPCKGRHDLIANDDVTNQLKALVKEWGKLTALTSMSALTATQALKKIEEHERETQGLRDILLMWSKDGRLPSARTVGNQLAKIKGRNLDGLILDCGLSSGMNAWFVKPASSR